MYEKIRKIDFAKFGPYISLAALFIISSFASEYFLQTQNLLNILRQVSYIGIIALGMTFVIIGGGIDLSVGSLVALLGCVMIYVLNQAGTGAGAIAASVSAGLALGALSGAVTGFMVTKCRMAPFIVTLGTMAIYRSLALYITEAGELRSMSDKYGAIGMGDIAGIPVPVWIFLLLAIFCAFLLNRTKYGRYVCAVGSNEKVASYAAIKVNRVRTLTYVITGLMVAISAFLLSARLNSISSTNAGVNFEIDAIAAVIIGGTAMTGGVGTIGGTVVGAIILGIVNNMLNMLGVSPYLQGTVKGLVIIFAVLIQRKK